MGHRWDNHGRGRQHDSGDTHEEGIMISDKRKPRWDFKWLLLSLLYVFEQSVTAQKSQANIPVQKPEKKSNSNSLHFCDILKWYSQERKHLPICVTQKCLILLQKPHWFHFSVLDFRNFKMIYSTYLTCILSQVPKSLIGSYFSFHFLKQADIRGALRTIWEPLIILPWHKFTWVKL